MARSLQGPICQQAADPLSRNHELDEALDDGRIAPVQFEPIGVGGRDDTLFPCFHGPCDRAAGGDRVHPGPVQPVVDSVYGVQVSAHEQGTEGCNRLVFRLVCLAPLPRADAAAAKGARVAVVLALFACQNAVRIDGVGQLPVVVPLAAGPVAHRCVTPFDRRLVHATRPPLAEHGDGQTAVHAGGSGMPCVTWWAHVRLNRVISCGSSLPMGREPHRTTALSFLDPMTAPSPERAAMRPPSLLMPAMSDRRSPAGPMHATDGSRFPATSFFSAASVSIVSLPHRAVASRSSGPWLST